MESISTQVAYHDREKIIDDKGFMVKFTMLIVLIISLAAYVVFQGFVTVDKLSLPFNTNNFSSLKLESIEKNLNGNSMDLSIVESDFEGLAELDLSDIEILDTQLIATPVSHTKSVSSSMKHAPAAKVKKKKVFISSQTVGSLSFIKKKFYATNNIAFSLLLSEKFLGQGAYDKALKWALISNEIDENNEHSWVLFAKAKVKLGRKQDAVNALSMFLKSNNSVPVKKILDEIVKKS